MAAPALSATRSTVVGASASTITINAMARAVGDGLMVEVWIENSAAAPATPEGWELKANKAGTANFQIRTYGRKGGATNTAADNFTMALGVTAFRFGEMLKITGNPADPSKWIVGTASNGSSTKQTILGVTTTSAQNLLLGLTNTFNETETTKIEPAGWTDNEAVWTPVIFREAAAAGATGNVELTINPTNPWITVMIAIPPAAAGVSIPLNSSSGVSGGSLSLTAPTKIPLAGAGGVGGGSLALTAKTTIALAGAGGAGGGALALTAPTKVPLSGSSGVGGAGNLGISYPIKVSLAPATGTGGGALTVSTPTKTPIPLKPSSGVAAAALRVTAPTRVPLTGSAGVGGGKLTIHVPIPPSFKVKREGLWFPL